MKMNYNKKLFKTEEEYKKFLDDKLKNFFNRIENNQELVSVFKRLKDR